MNERYQQIYEDENGNEIPHFDLAENIDYDNSESGLDGKNVQQAIDQLSRPAAIRYLEECEVEITENGETTVIDYDSLDIGDTYPTFVLPQVTVKEYIYYGSDEEIDWSSITSNLNPTTWSGTAFHKYTIGNSSWKKLTSSSPNTTKTYVYVSYRSRDLYEFGYHGWSEPILLSELLESFTEDNPNDIMDISVSSNYNDVKAEYENNEINKVLFDKARKTRLFLQGILDNAGPDDVIVFPKDKVLVIDFDPSGYQDECFDVRKTYKSDLTTITTSTGVIYPYWYKISFVGLLIRKRATLDLNGSTIAMIPNWLHNSKLIWVTNGFYLGTRPANTPDPTGTIIKNGKVLGGTKIYFPSPGSNDTDYEHAHCISAAVTVNIENMNIGETGGDGISTSSLKSGNSYDVSSGKLTASGATENVDNYYTTGFVSISELNDDHYDRYDVVIRPLVYDSVNTKSEFNTMIDIAPFYINEFIIVSYYASENSASHISQQTIKFGDSLIIPSNAKYLKCSINYDISKSDYSTIRNNANLKVKAFIFAVQWAYHHRIINCEIHDCGRDGMTLGSMPSSEIKDVRIQKCSQYNVDIENVAYLDDGLIINNLNLSRSQKGLSAATGSHLTIEHSKLSSISFIGPQLVISDCDISTLNSGPLAGGTTIKTFNANISRPRRLIKNTVIRKTTYAVDTLFENCIFTGSFDCLKQEPRVAKYYNVFKDCTIKTTNLGPGIYERCRIISDDVIALTNFYKATTDNSKYIFKNCNITCLSMFRDRQTLFNEGANIYNHGPLLIIEDCNITFKGHSTTKISGSTTSVSHFFDCWVERMTGNVITFEPFSSNKYEFLVKPYNNPLIERNVFKSSNSVPAVWLISLELSDLPDHYNKFIEILKNTVNFHENSAANSNKFVQVTVMDATVDSDVVVDKNTFVCVDDNVGDATNVLLKANASGVTNTLVTVTSSNSKAVNAADPVEYNIN